MYAWVGEPDPPPFLCTSTIQTLSIGRAPLPFSPSAASNPRQRRARRYRRNQSSRDLALASPGLSSPGGSNQLLTPSVASPPLSNYHLLQGILTSRRLLHRCLTRHVKWQGQEMKPNELPRNIKSWRQERCNIWSSSVNSPAGQCHLPNLVLVSHSNVE